MSPRTTSAFVCLLATATPASSFAPTSSTLTSPSQRTSALHMSSIPHATEEQYPQLLSNASLCAHSDTCSIDLAEDYLREIIHVQSGCAAGTISGNAVCDDVLSVSEIVADLREKISHGAKQEVGTFWDKRQEELETLAAASGGSSLAAALTAPVKPAYLAIGALYTIVLISLFGPASMDLNANGVVPFTAQEVWWSIRDGYVGDLANHLFHNGGLVVGEPMASVGSSLSPQELLWSIRDGYADNALAGVGGGVESLPFTPQEVWWAIKNGYSYDMIEHWVRNGGLSV